MKKLTFIILAICSLAAQAQVFVGGKGRLGYANDRFLFAVVPEVGYEINEKWAVGAALGFSLSAGDGNCTTLGVAEPFVRYTVWSNERVAFDVKAMSELNFKNELIAAEIGLRPSVRFFLNEKWDMNADFGLLGATYEGEWKPAFLATALSGSIGVAYKF